MSTRFNGTDGKRQRPLKGLLRRCAEDKNPGGKVLRSEHKAKKKKNSDIKVYNIQKGQR